MSSPTLPLPHVDFVLPGHDLDASACNQWLNSIIAAYSRQWNERNIEAPWYEPWGLLFAHLVAGCDHLAVAPQYFLPNSRDASSNDDAGNTSLDSIMTNPGKQRGCIPDFCIIRKCVVAREGNHALTTVWHIVNKRVDHLDIPLLCEAKRAGRRHKMLINNLEDAMGRMHDAKTQVENQARCLFRLKPNQTSVILVAVTGLWWTCRIAQRSEKRMDSDPESDDVAYVEEGDEEDRNEKALPNPSDSSDPDVIIAAELETKDPEERPYLQSVKNYIQRPLTTNVTLTTSRWSGYLFTCSPASRQFLFLIHQELSQL